METNNLHSNGDYYYNQLIQLQIEIEKKLEKIFNFFGIIHLHQALHHSNLPKCTVDIKYNDEYKDYRIFSVGFEKNEMVAFGYEEVTEGDESEIDYEESVFIPFDDLNIENLADVMDAVSYYLCSTFSVEKVQEFL